jgi:hypothetical protein
LITAAALGAAARGSFDGVRHGGIIGCATSEMRTA